MGIRSRDGGESCRSSFPSPSSSSSSSSDFEFAVSLSPTSKRPLSCCSQQQCPADELFYKGQLLPLQLSPRISMVRALLLASSSSSASSDTTATTGSRDSNGSTSSSFSAELSARPSSATDDDAAARAVFYESILEQSPQPLLPKRAPKYFSSFASRFSSVFLLHRGVSKKDHHPANLHHIPLSSSSSSSSRSTTTTSSSYSSSTKEVIKKYVKKVKPLYEKLSSLQQIRQQQQQNQNKKAFTFSIRKDKSAPRRADDLGGDGISHGSNRRSKIFYMHSNSFSGNLKFPRKKPCAASCPSSMRSSPTHSGLLSISSGVSGGFPDLNPALASSSLSSSSSSSMEELQSAIQGAIAHCKSSMIQAANQKKSASAALSNDD